MMSGAALALVVTVAALMCASSHAAINAAVATTTTTTDCSVGITPTVTFVTSCRTVSVTDAACWTPHAPTSTDIVLFPGGTNASIPYLWVFTPLSVKSIVIAGGAIVTMEGGALAVSECLQVSGSLILDTGMHVDNGTMSTVAYAADPSVPMGTDCSAIPRGFSPRICGPGAVYVSGTVSLTGLFASLWAKTTVAASATLTFNDESFLWGNVTNFGSISANRRMFYHGALYNQPGANAQFSMVRPDFWTTDPGVENATLFLVNYGSMKFTLPKDYDINYEFISTKDNMSVPFVTLVIENHDNLEFNSWLRRSNVNTWFESAVDLTNFGTTTWRGIQYFWGMGVATNYGAFVANAATVGYQNYISHGGSQIATNGGGFNLGLSEATTEALKSRGHLGPYITLAAFANSKFLSPDATGTLNLHTPIVLDGVLEIGAGATLRNAIPHKKATLLLPGGSGKIVVAGAYFAGVEEELKDDRTSVQVSSTGTYWIPAGHRVIFHEGSHFAISQSGLLRVDGKVLTRSSKTGATKRHNFHEHAFGAGIDRIEGDFVLDGLVPIDM